MRDEGRQMRSLREELERLEPAFEPGFRDRVMARIRELPTAETHGARSEQPGADTLYMHLSWAFPRLAAACLVGVVVLGIYSLSGDGGLASSTLEALLGLPGETLETAFVLASG